MKTTRIYEPAYLVGGGMNIDPALLLASVRSIRPGSSERSRTALLADGGRNLVAKAEMVRDRDENRAPCRLDDLDRAKAAERVGYISAMTATGSDDGEHRDYADIAEAIRDLSRSSRQDHHELYDRAVANVALGNTDDHLRNHGFLADHGSWTLSPAFDVNPSPDLTRTRSTSIAGADSYPSEVEGLLALAEDCSLSVAQARGRMNRVVASLSGWRDQARRNKVAAVEIALMAESVEPRLRAVAAAGRA